MIQNNNIVNIQNDNNYFLINFRYILANTIQFIAFTVFSYIVGAILILLYCVLIGSCEKNTNKILADAYYAFLKIMIGSLIICCICVGGRQRNRLVSMRREIINNDTRTNRIAVV